jgi:hypothetical protein
MTPWEVEQALFEYRAKVYQEQMELLDQRHRHQHQEEFRRAMFLAKRAHSYPPDKPAAVPGPVAQTTMQMLDEAIARSRKASIERQQGDAASADPKVRELGRELREAKDNLARLAREGVVSSSVPTEPVLARKGVEMGSMILEENRGLNLGVKDLKRLHDEHVRTEGHEMPGGKALGFEVFVQQIRGTGLTLDEYQEHYGPPVVPPTRQGAPHVALLKNGAAVRTGGVLSPPPGEVRPRLEAIRKYHVTLFDRLVTDVSRLESALGIGTRRGGSFEWPRDWALRHYGPPILDRHGRPDGQGALAHLKSLVEREAREINAVSEQLVALGPTYCFGNSGVPVGP